MQVLSVSYPHRAFAWWISKKSLLLQRNSLFMSKQTKMTLGFVLKKLREDNGFSLRGVEDETGISNAYLSQLENDKAKKPSANILHKLADLYKSDFGHLLSLAGIVENESEVNKSFGEYVFSKNNLSKDEEEELLQYLQFMRRRDSKKS